MRSSQQHTWAWRMVRPRNGRGDRGAAVHELERRLSSRYDIGVARRREHGMAGQPQEVDLEALDPGPWWQKALSSLAAGPAYASYRFVARSSDADSGAAPTVVRERHLSPAALH